MVFITAVALTAIVITVVNNNNEKEEYKFDDGTYYQETKQDAKTGYIAVTAPIGAKVPTLPSDNTSIFTIYPNRIMGILFMSLLSIRDHKFPAFS